MLKDDEDRHVSVMPEEVSSLFAEAKLETFVDGTLGAGGHAKTLLLAHPEIECYVGIDQDPEALSLAKKRLEKWKDKVHFCAANFVDFDSFLSAPCDGMLLDLGVSSMQFDQPEKGFSFSFDGPLDMRMNPKEPLTAEEVVNTWSEKELGRVIRQYGEEKYWRRIARAIVEKRPINTTRELVDVIVPVIPKKRGGGIHPATLTFQALRICVNKELEVLQHVLPKAIDALAPKGILAVISFHSLEDRLVKNAFRYAASDKELTSGLEGLFLDKEPKVKVLTKKPLVASEEEVARNPRARSAKLRAVLKL